MSRPCPMCRGFRTVVVLPEAEPVEVLSWGTVAEWEARAPSSPEAEAAWLHGQWWRLLGALTSKAAALGRVPRFPDSVTAEVIQLEAGDRVVRLRAATEWIG